MSSAKGSTVIAPVGQMAAARSRSAVRPASVRQGRPRNSGVSSTASRSGMYCFPWLRSTRIFGSIIVFR